MSYVQPLEKLSKSLKSYLSESLKFGYYEKATKFEKIFHLKFDVTEWCQILSGSFFSNFVAFSEYPYFTRSKGTRISLSDCDIINSGSTNGLFFPAAAFFDRESTRWSMISIFKNKTG